MNIYHETHTHTTYYSLLIPVTVSRSSGTVARPGLKHWKSNAHATTPQSTYTVISCLLRVLLWWWWWLYDHDDDDDIAITEDDERCCSSVRCGRLKANEISGIIPMNRRNCQLTASSHTTRNIHREPVSEYAIDPLSVEYRRRLVPAVRVVVPSCLVAGVRRAR